MTRMRHTTTLFVPALLCTSVALSGCSSNEAPSVAESASTPSSVIAPDANVETEQDQRGEPNSSSTPQADTSTPDDTYMIVNFGDESMTFNKVTQCEYRPRDKARTFGAGWRITAFTEGRKDVATLTFGTEESSVSFFTVYLDLANPMLGLDPEIKIGAIDDEKRKTILNGEIIDGVGSGTATMSAGLSGEGDPVEVTWEVSCKPSSGGK